MAPHRILHLADLHLGFEHSYLGARAAKRMEETVQTLERVVDWALDSEQRIAAVLIAGDLFETHRPDSRLLGRVIQILKKIPASGRALVTVPGNHDEFSYPDSVYRQQLSSWPGTLVTCPHLERVASFDLGDATCAVHSLAFTSGVSEKRLAMLENLRAPSASTKESDKKRKVAIALLHGMLDADPTDRTYRIDSGLLSESGFAYAALGHIHKPAQSRFGEGIALYPGTLNGKGFDDPGVGELTVVSFPGGRPRVEGVPIAVRSIRTVAIDTHRYESQEQLIDEYERKPEPEAIVRLVLEGIRSGEWDTDSLKGRLEGSFHHLEIEDRSVSVSPADIERIASQPTIKGAFVQLMRERIAAAEAESRAQDCERLHAALMRGLAAFETMAQSR